MSPFSALALLTTIFVYALYPAISHADGCEGGHWITSVIADGRYIQLEDGTLWEVAWGDEIDASLWLPTSDVIVCDGSIINLDDDEAVQVIPVYR